MSNRHDVKAFVRYGVHDRERKPSKDEVTQLLVDQRAQFWMIKQDTDDSLYFATEVAAES